MNTTFTANDFTMKFAELNESNQRYIIAIQQALLYSQEHEKQERQKRHEKQKGENKKK